MLLSGPVVHQQLSEAYGLMQAELEQLRGKMDQADDYREHLSHQRRESLIKLAKHYLPDLTTESIEKTWDRVQPDITKVLLRKQHRCDELQQELDELNQNRLTLEQTLVELNQQISQAETTLGELTGRVEERLRGDDQFVQLSDRAAMAEAALERAEANLQEIDQESARKLPAYEANDLFGYLLDRQFGTPHYSKKGLVRRMDRWVAKLIGYRKAKQSYDFLKQTPDNMRQIIAEDRDAFEVVMGNLEQQRDEVAGRLGLPDQMEHVGKLSGRREELLDQIDGLLSESAAKERERTQLDDPRGPFYQEAIELFRKLLSNIDLDDLEQAAKETIEISDDQIVANLIGLDDQLETFEDQAKTHIEEIRRRQEFLEQFGRFMQRFRGAGFDSSRSQFVDTLDVFAQLKRGQASGDIQAVWDHIRRSQRWGPTAMDKVGQVAAHPMTQVLVSAMAQAAGSAMGSYAQRAGQRRERQHSPKSGSWNRRRW